MALNSTPRRRFGVTLGAVLTGVAASLIGFAGTASAHTPDLKASCEGDTTTLWVHLKSYNAEKSNTVKITDGGQTLADTSFKSGYEKSFKTSGAVDHVFTVTVKAWDDPQGEKGFSFTKELKVEKCVIETTTTTTTTESSTSETTPPSETSSSPSETPTSSSSSAPPVSSTVVPTTTTTAAVEEAALAETGASIGLPLGIAGVLLVGGGVLLFIVRRRGKA